MINHRADEESPRSPREDLGRLTRTVPRIRGLHQVKIRTIRVRFSCGSLVSRSLQSRFFQPRKPRNVTCLCLPRSRSPLISLFSTPRDVGDANERGFPILGIGRSWGGRRRECLRGSIERIALAHSHRVCRSSLEISVCPPSVRSIARSLARSCGTPFFAVPARGPLEKTVRDRQDRRRKQNVPTRDRPMRRYAVRSTGLLKARSKA